VAAKRKKVDPVSRAEFEEFKEDTRRHMRRMDSRHLKLTGRTSSLEKTMTSVLKALEENTRITRQTRETAEKSWDTMQMVANSVDQVLSYQRKEAALDTPAPLSDDTLVRPGPPVSETLHGQ
jgi:tRNA A37 N6-isopentenylltransferase MiaA